MTPPFTSETLECQTIMKFMFCEKRLHFMIFMVAIEMQHINMITFDGHAGTLIGRTNDCHTIIGCNADCHAIIG